jgi:hypothetical protein
VQYGIEARRELARFNGPPYDVAQVDIEREFLTALRAVASTKRVRWDTLVSADLAQPGTTDYTNLRILTHEAAITVEQRVLTTGPQVLAWNAGVLARYGEMGVIDRWRAVAGLAGSSLQTLWLVAFGSTVEPKPMMDGHAVPVLGVSEWVEITSTWLANRHRHAIGEVAR